MSDLNDQIAELNAAKTPNSGKLQDTIANRTSLQSRIDTLQQSLEDATLRNSAVVSSSRVLDPPAAEPGRAKRSLALGLASGLIGGTALGWGGVLFLAITSNRLRRRADVARVLGADVKVSVGRIIPLRKFWTWLPPLQAVDRRRTYERSRLARAIGEELLRPTRQSRLTVACMDNAAELGYAVTDAARDLVERGYSITIIDLTERGSRGLRAASNPKSAVKPTVLRSRGFPALAHSVNDLIAVGQWDSGENTPAPELTDVTLVVAELDPGIGAEHLASWTDRVGMLLGIAWPLQCGFLLLVVDSTKLCLQAGSVDAFPDDLPPVLRDTIPRLDRIIAEAMDEVEREKANRALSHLYKLLQQQDGPIGEAR